MSLVVKLMMLLDARPYNSSVFISKFSEIWKSRNYLTCAKKCFLALKEGERRGLVVNTEDCRSKGRGIESRSFYLFIVYIYIRLNSFHVANDLQLNAMEA